MSVEGVPESPLHMIIGTGEFLTASFAILPHHSMYSVPFFESAFNSFSTLYHNRLWWLKLSGTVGGYD